jgi:hypothetical protein
VSAEPPRRDLDLARILRIPNALRGFPRPVDSQIVVFTLGTTTRDRGEVRSPDAPLDRPEIFVVSFLWNVHRTRKAR